MIIEYGSDRDRQYSEDGELEQPAERENLLPDGMFPGAQHLRGGGGLEPKIIEYEDGRDDMPEQQG